MLTIIPWSGRSSLLFLCSRCESTVVIIFCWSSVCPIFNSLCLLCVERDDWLLALCLERSSKKLPRLRRIDCSVRRWQTWPSIGRHAHVTPTRGSMEDQSTMLPTPRLSDAGEQNHRKILRSLKGAVHSHVKSSSFSTVGFCRTVR